MLLNSTELTAGFKREEAKGDYLCELFNNGVLKALLGQLLFNGLEQGKEHCKMCHFIHLSFKGLYQ